jgi:trans-aconitate 2-methyltransferase
MYKIKFSNWKTWVFAACLLATRVILGAGLEDPKEYEKHSNRQWVWALHALDRYPWQGTERVLDIGCGDGKISAFISEKQTRGPVIGLDISEAMIHFASNAFGPDQFPNLVFQQGDITSLPFHGQFDLITSFCSFKACALEGD